MINFEQANAGWDNSPFLNFAGKDFQYKAKILWIICAYACVTISIAKMLLHICSIQQSQQLLNLFIQPNLMSAPKVNSPNTVKEFLFNDNAILFEQLNANFKNVL